MHKLLPMRKALIIISILISSVVLLVVSGYFVSQNLDVEYYDIDKELPEEIKICHLSDLHYPKNGLKAEKILDAIMGEKPDIIVMTGDMLDESADDINMTDFAAILYSLRKIAPIFAVLGNHEVGKNLSAFSEICEGNKVKLLIDKSEYITIKNTGFLITGLNDGRVLSERNLPEYFALKEKIDPDVTVLLAHRPELVRNYSDGGFDVVFCGHAHGGQARIFNKGVYAPDQGFLPPYTSGRYIVNGVNMFVSRGLGDGNNDFRIYNSYNMILVTIL